MALHELQQCLTLLKQALHCPICLDDLKSPVITPCAHIFCNFCITHYTSTKRSVKCPLCNKSITKRLVVTFKTCCKISLFSR
uniref:RING-type domain-containing protein n=1 Tax=Mesocestoides corti TaxID=53468 RepID=A0A5K3F8T3_MESCO